MIRCLKFRFKIVVDNKYTSRRGGMIVSRLDSGALRRTLCFVLRKTLHPLFSLSTWLVLDDDYKSRVGYTLNNC